MLASSACHAPEGSLHNQAVVLEFFDLCHCAVIAGPRLHSFLYQCLTVPHSDHNSRTCIVT